MCRLSVFRGGFSRAAAAAVCRTQATGNREQENTDTAAESLSHVPANLLPTLASLIDKSLLRRSGDGRYDMHELVRQYAATHLNADAHVYAATRDRHAAFYMGLVQQREAELKRARQ